MKNQIETVIEELYKDQGYKLRQMCNKEMAKFGGISQKDYDDFYSRVGYEITKAKKSYDPLKGKTFAQYISGVIRLAICKEMSYRNRMKRQTFTEKEEVDSEGNIVKIKEYVPDISIDSPIEDGVTIADTLQSDFDMDDVLFENMVGCQDENVEKYLKTLPYLQGKILKMKMENVSVSQIKEELGLSDKEYVEQFNQIKSFNNIRTINQLFGNSSEYVGKEEEIVMMTTQTAEKSKPMQYSIASINKKIDNRTIRFDHPLQRESDQWNPSMKGNLISDILQGNPLPEIVFAEQIINGIPVIWDLDGKQRCTNCYSFVNDGFKISRNIRRWNIKYIAQIRDEHGKPVLDKGGYPTSEYKEFDIRNKKFSQLPKELQDKFLEYTFKCDQYLNCDSDEIAYHIIRYNEGKQMSKSQKGITRIGEEFAALVKSISAMPFFRDRGGYKVSETKNGTLERVIIESVMASKYLNDWNKQQEVICEYLKENAKTEDFYDFEDMVERLDSVITDEVADMFDSKDSFLWFSLFARFKNTGEDDKKFVEFMAEFSQSLHNKQIDGKSYDELCIDKKTGKTRATKDKYIVVPKLDLLEKLMLDFLHIEQSNIDTDENKSDIVTFIKNNVNSDILEEDIEQYAEVLEDLTLNVDNSSKLLEKNNKFSLIAIVAYSFDKDIDLDDWIVDFFARNDIYIKNQKENYIYMKKDLENFILDKTKKSA